MKTGKIFVVASVVGILVGPFMSGAYATTFTWDGTGGDGNWNSGANWVGDPASGPAATGDDLVFDGSTRLTNTNNLPVTGLVGITFNNTAGAFGLYSSGSIALAGNITDNSTALQTLLMPLAISGARTVSVTSGGRLVFGKSGTSLAYSVNNGTSLFTGERIDVLTSGTFQIATANATTLDMSGLNKFVGEFGILSVSGTAQLTAAVNGTLTLSKDNTITATNVYLGWNAGNFVCTGTMNLGAVNVIKADLLGLGQKRSSGNMSFNGATGSSVTITSSTGGKANMYLGDYNTSNTAQSPTGIADFTGGTVTATLGTLIIGRQDPNGNSNATGNGIGRFTVDGASSSVTVDTMRLGYWANSRSPTANQFAYGYYTNKNGTVTISTVLKVADQGSFGATSGNTFTRSQGFVVVEGGTVDVSGAFVLGDRTGSAGGAATDAQATLRITGGAVVSHVNITTKDARSTLVLNGGTLDMKGNTIGTAAQQIGSNGGALNFQSGYLYNVSEINGGAGLTKTTTGNLTVTNLTYGGNTVIVLGSLRAGADNALPNGTGKGNVVIDGGATAGTLDLRDHDVAINGLSGTTGTTLGMVANNNGSATKTLTLGNNDATADFSGAIIDNTGTGGKVAIAKTGTGTQTLSGSNTYTGGTQINKGILAVSGGSALADDGAVSLADVSGATLRLDNSEAIGSLAGGGATGGNVNLQANALTVGDANDTTYGGAISGAGGSLIKQGAGKLAITNTHSFDGGTEIQNGTLALSGGGLLDTGALNVNGSGAKFDLGGGSDTVGAVTLTDGQINNGTLTGSGYTVKKGSVGAALAGAGSALIKETAGTVTLSNVNTYGGGTTVNNGTLAVSGTVSGGATVAGGTLQVTGTGTLNGGATVNGGKLVADGTVNGAVTVNSGGTLGGSGTLADATTIAMGGTLSPGNSPGQLTHEDGLTLSNGSTYVWELVVNDAGVAGTDFDQELITGGNLLVDSGATLSLVFNSAGSSVDWSNLYWADPHQWVMMDFSSVGTSSGNFGTVNVSLDSGDAVLADTRPGYVFTSVRSGNNLLINYDVIPEPATAGVLLMGLMGLALRRRALNAD